MGLEIFQVDAFTDRPFVGNPAAVCVLSEPKDEKWMQNVAAEVNLSETAFLQRQKDGFELRWFTPTVEVDLCGHATLASAHILWEQGHLKPDEQARFHARSGLLTAARTGDWIGLNFPLEPEDQTATPAGLTEALGVKPEYVGKTRFDYLVEVESEEAVRRLKPDMVKLAAIPVRGVMVTSGSASKDYDFVSRFFAPGAGIDEDPVTGSAHCCLGPFWGSRLGKTEVIGYQASARGGFVRVRMNGDRVALYGKAITVLRGELAPSASS